MHYWQAMRPQQWVKNAFVGAGFLFAREWRDAALAYDRSFYLFDGATLESARLAWKLLSGREGVERRYWAQIDGRWKQQS